MEIGQLQNLLPTPHLLIPALIKGFKPLFELEAFKNYDVIFHNVNNQIKRKNKRVKKQTSEINPTTQKPVVEEVMQQVVRIAIPMQKLIVETATTFLTGGKVELKALPRPATTAIDEEMIAFVSDTWENNKLQYKNGSIAEAMMSQTEVAEIWYRDVDEDGNPVMKMNVFMPSDGYTLQPIFDSLKNLIGFGLYYTQKTEGNKTVKYYDLYTATELRKYYLGESGTWELMQLPVVGSENSETGDAIIELNYGKIPVVYYSQPRSEWYDVQSMIDRLEFLLSNHGDTNDYSGSPVLFATAPIKQMPEKGEPGKLIESTVTGGDLKYVTPENATESYKLEVDNLKNFIMLCTQTPDLSLESLKGLGQIPSGEAFKRVLIATYMKARRKQTGAYGECVQRRVNFLKAAGASINPKLNPARTLRITPDYQPFTIDDLAERIENAMKANGNKAVMSREESIKYVGISSDAAATLKDIKNEEDSEGSPLID